MRCTSAVMVLAACLVVLLRVSGTTAPIAPVTQDVIYGKKLGMALTLDVHAADTPNGAGILLINSGGYVSPFCRFVTGEGAGLRAFTDAELDTGQPLCRELKPGYMTAAGFTVFEVRHGSSPRFNVADATADVTLAVQFVRRRARDFGVDPARLGVWGGSAGGQLALRVGLDDTAPAAEPKVAAIVAYFPPHDLEALVRDYPERIKPFPAVATMQPEQLRAVSPVHHVTPRDPPTLIVHGDADQLVPYTSGKSMYDALRAQGVTSELLTLEGAPHGFTGSYADRALVATLNWFKTHLGGQR